MPKKIEELMDANGRLKEGALKHLLNNTISTIEDNKKQIFDIYETAQNEVEECKRTLERVRKEVHQTIDKVDALEKEEQIEKQKLVRVSGNFKEYSEEAIRGCYEAVKNVQVALGVERDKEASLRNQRDALEFRLKNLQIMLAQAEHLALAIGSVLNYLSSQVTGVVWQIEAVQKEKFVGARIIKAQEEERFRISREMHDGPAQDLANLIFQASICEKLIDFDPEEAKANLKELREQIRACLSDVRKVIFDMRPMALDDLGLVAAIDQLIAKLSQRGALEASFSVDGSEQKLSKHLEIAAFRIVQEALNNVANHAGTTSAKVRMLYTNSALSILIEDEGGGFDVDAQAGSVNIDEDGEQEGHFGLVSMKERAKLIEAELNITSVIGKGTKVHLRIPMKKEDIAVPVMGEPKGKR